MKVVLLIAVFLGVLAIRYVGDTVIDAVEKVKLNNMSLPAYESDWRPALARR